MVSESVLVLVVVAIATNMFAARALEPVSAQLQRTFSDYSAKTGTNDNDIWFH